MHRNQYLSEASVRMSAWRRTPLFFRFMWNLLKSGPLICSCGQCFAVRCAKRLLCFPSAFAEGLRKPADIKIYLEEALREANELLTEGLLMKSQKVWHIVPLHTPLITVSHGLDNSRKAIFCIRNRGVAAAQITFLSEPAALSSKEGENNVGKSSSERYEYQWSTPRRPPQPRPSL